MASSKSVFSSKTMWFNAVAFLLAVAAMVSGSFPLSPEYAVFAQAVGNMVLRYVTNKPVSF